MSNVWSVTSKSRTIQNTSAGLNDSELEDNEQADSDYDEEGDDDDDEDEEDGSEAGSEDDQLAAAVRTVHSAREPTALPKTDQSLKRQSKSESSKSKRKKAAVAPPSSRKKTSEFSKYLVDALGALVQHNVRYSKEYFAYPFSENTRGYHFCYVMNVGCPSDTEKEPIRRKSSTAYFGLSDTEGTAIERLRIHNSKDTTNKCLKTSASAGRWVLCMVLFLPPEFRLFASAWLPHDFGVVGHGFAGKIRRAFQLIKLFNFRFHVIKEHLDAVRKVVPIVDDFDHRQYRFHPEWVDVDAPILQKK